MHLNLNNLQDATDITKVCVCMCVFSEISETMSEALYTTVLIVVIQEWWDYA